MPAGLPVQRTIRALVVGSFAYLPLTVTTCLTGVTPGSIGLLMALAVALLIPAVFGGREEWLYHARKQKGDRRL